MNRLKKHDTLILTLITLGAAALFIFLYWRSLIPIEAAEPQPTNPLEDWDISQSDMNGAPFEEDKGIYTQDTDIYDVYISVFPTKDKNGNMLELSCFDLHSARDHSYNPILNCNIQILPEGERPDPLLDLDHKNATIRVRGNSSRGASYKSYKVRLDQEAGDFFGQTNLNINKHAGDISKISTKLQTDLLAQVDHIGRYRTYFMRLWIRDASLPADEQEFEYYGLYTETEQPNKTYLEARSLSSNAVMYKAQDFSFALNDALKNVDDPLYSEEDFESVLSIREGNNHEKLLEMLEAVNDPTADFNEVFHKYFDEENYLTWLAFNLLMGNEDIINHNFILYSPSNSITWYFLPWDFDGALRFGSQKGTFSQPDSLRGIQTLNSGILHRRYFRLDGSIEKLDNKMKELLDTAISHEKVQSLIESYKPVLSKTMYIMPDIYQLDMYPDELFLYVDDIYDGIVGNYEAVHAAIEYPAPMFVAQPERYPDGSVRFAWEPSYSYQQRPVTYTIRIYNDYQMQNLLCEQSGISQTECFLGEELENGTYYLLVTATDSMGNEQLSMEHYESAGVYVFGLLEFTLK